MRFTDIFIRRPVLAASISFLIALMGLYALKGMQVREYPDMTNTTVSVTTSYYGASSDLIQGFITQPLEQAIAQADNIDFMTSQSMLGRSTITAYMKLNTDPNDALANIMAKVNSVRAQLPSEAEDPTVAVAAAGGTSLIYISFSSDTLNSSQINDYLERVVQAQLFTVDGVAKVNLYGGIKFALRIWLDPQRMAAYGLTAEDVLQVLAANNYQAAPGQVVGRYTLMNGNADTQVSTADDLKKLVVASRPDGVVVRVRDIAEVTLEKSHDSVRALANGKQAVVVGIEATPTANPLDVIKGVRKMLPDIDKAMPDTIKMRILYDATRAIDESINEVVHTIGEAALIVLVVITLFLGNLRAVLIPVITIPLSLIGVAMLMSLFGFSLNLMTLLSMVLAIGLVVDDAIVVVENVDRHIKLGEPPFRAAIIGTREIALPVITMTLTLAAVYAPIALMGGITGALFKEFALTLAGAVFVSGVVALTLSPMMCAKLLKPHQNPNRFERGVESTLAAVNRRYEVMLAWMLEHRPLVITFAAIVFISLPFLFKVVPQELAPNEDKGGFMMLAKAPTNANLDYIEDSLDKVSERAKQLPEIDGTLALPGVPAANQGLGIAILKPWSERSKSQKQLVQEINQRMRDLPYVSVSAFEFPELPGSSGGLPVQLVISTPQGFESLFQVAGEVFDKVRKNPLFVYSEMDLAFDSANLQIKVNRDKAGAYGITMQAIGRTLSTMVSDGYVSRIDLNGRSYEVIPQVKRVDRLNPASLGQYYVRAADGKQIPLSSLITMEVSGKPRSLNHYNQLNSATIGMVPAPGTAMGDAVAFLKQQGEALPKGYQYDFLGESRQYVKEGSALFATFALALAVIFLVLASQFESLRDPLVILVSVPLAICGALVALAWGLSTMNIYAEVGLITLIGLITKHGILICEVAKEQQLHHGRSRREAVIAAAGTRLRPILMTTAAMVAGLIPLLFAQGAGAISRFSIGIVIVSGLTIGTLFTLFVLPVIYTFLASEHKPLPVFEEAGEVEGQQAPVGG
ncbi:multidrug efflux RND transporter permease subunit [Gallaecimonas kandeliae]|uniref:multidrug efflux RND transporter permease subunit n=1 Tax=Gallaecimonas kandeliae TaxID=3029055 RepID=UPI0026488CD4|nr:multidrug efflux RND transporter permease subunit [Gallaecimonas kandeliae]WKE65610.1 multidrug efflux RND transporter permease subunit [Gallaecimonas kandeliae]